jgi:hypothetical protein
MPVGRIWYCGNATERTHVQVLTNCLLDHDHGHCLHPYFMHATQKSKCCSELYVTKSGRAAKRVPNRLFYLQSIWARMAVLGTGMSVIEQRSTGIKYFEICPKQMAAKGSIPSISFNII